MKMSRIVEKPKKCYSQEEISEDTGLSLEKIEALAEELTEKVDQ